MERLAWRGKIKPGCKNEYIKRHTEIWPKMIEVLKQAGICNYTILQMVTSYLDITNAKWVCHMQSVFSRRVRW